jgi:hypothetical protein
MELEHVHAILRKLAAVRPDEFLREEASVARELARAAAVVATPLVHCECVRRARGCEMGSQPPARSWLGQLA